MRSKDSIHGYVCCRTDVTGSQRVWFHLTSDSRGDVIDEEEQTLNYDK